MNGKHLATFFLLFFTCQFVFADIINPVPGQFNENPNQSLMPQQLAANDNTQQYVTTNVQNNASFNQAQPQMLNQNQTIAANGTMQPANQPVIINQGGNQPMTPGTQTSSQPSTVTPADQSNTTNPPNPADSPTTMPSVPPGPGFAPTPNAPVTSFPTPQTVPPASQTLQAPPQAATGTPSIPTTQNQVNPQVTQPIQTVPSASEVNQTPQQPSFGKPGQAVLPGYNELPRANRPPFNQDPVPVAPISPQNPPSTEKNIPKSYQQSLNDDDYALAFPSNLPTGADNYTG